MPQSCLICQSGHPRYQSNTGLLHSLHYRTQDKVTMSVYKAPDVICTVAARHSFSCTQIISHQRPTPKCLLNTAAPECLLSVITVQGTFMHCCSFPFLSDKNLFLSF